GFAFGGRDSARPRYHCAVGYRLTGRPRRGVPPVMNDQLTYERALELLDQKLKVLEDGDLSLDAALSVADEARTYLKICEQRPEEARKRIEVRPEASGTEEGRGERSATASLGSVGTASAWARA